MSYFTLSVNFFSALHDLGCIVSQKTHSTSYFSKKKIFRVPTTQKTVFLNVFFCILGLITPEQLIFFLRTEVIYVHWPILNTCLKVH